MTIQYEIRITGRVQGVGFRYFVQKRAAEFHVKGWVKNTPDGGVLVMAAGEKADIETFIEHLQVGPTMARVQKLEKNQMPVVENFPDFRVRH